MKGLFVVALMTLLALEASACYDKKLWDTFRKGAPFRKEPEYSGVHWLKGAPAALRKDKVHMHLFMTSQCQNVAGVIKIMYKVLKKYKKYVDPHVDYVLHQDHTRQKFTDHYWIHAAQGRAEVVRDKYGLCAQEIYKKKPELWMKYTYCMIKHRSTSHEADCEYCAKKASISYGSLKGCVGSTKGHKLAKVSMKRTYWNKVYYAPTVYLRGLKYQGKVEHLYYILKREIRHIDRPLTDKDCAWDYWNHQCKDPEWCEYRFNAGDADLDNSCKMRWDPDYSDKNWHLTFNKPRSQLYIPNVNPNCEWDYEAQSCANPAFCEYRFEFGDITLDQSCRLKRFPTTDSECSYSYGDGMCAFPSICEYHFKAGDMTLDDSCRMIIEPVSDEDCFWDYQANACAHPDRCTYHYAEGDTVLDESCRIHTIPESDEQCTWNYKDAECYDQQFCEFRHEIGDGNLDHSCRLKKEHLPCSTEKLLKLEALLKKRHAATDVVHHHVVEHHVHHTHDVHDHHPVSYIIP